MLRRLNEAENAALAEWTPHCLPENCQADIDNHRGVIDKTSAFQSKITALIEEGKGLKAQGSQEDQAQVDHWLNRVEQMFERVVAHNERKKVCVMQIHYTNPLMAKLDNIT